MNVGGAFTGFSNINERSVGFYGYGFNYSYYFYKEAGFVIGFDHYFPATYYGKYVDVPVYIKGGANAFNLGLRYKIIDPDSKKIEINSTFGFSFLKHEGIYHIEETEFSDILNKVRSIYAGVEFILNKSRFPFAISAGYNFVQGQKKPFIDWSQNSVPFSSSITLRAAISLPVMRGPTPSQIKQIVY